MALRRAGGPCRAGVRLLAACDVDCVLDLFVPALDHRVKDLLQEGQWLEQVLGQVLEQGLGDGWSPELAAAWATAYGVLADTMIVAAAEAPAA